MLIEFYFWFGVVFALGLFEQSSQEAILVSGWGLGACLVLILWRPLVEFLDKIFGWVPGFPRE
jgi:hypothetical protein